VSDHQIAWFDDLTGRVSIVDRTTSLVEPPARVELGHASDLYAADDLIWAVAFERVTRWRDASGEAGLLWAYMR